MARVIFLLTAQARVIFLLTEEKFFRNQPIRNKNCLWQPCVLTDRDKMSNLYREPSIDASYQVLVYLAKRFQRKRYFQKSTNQKQELLVVDMFAIRSGRNEMQNLYRGPSIDASYQISILLAQRFQRRRFFQKSTNEKQELSTTVKFVKQIRTK